MPLRSSQILAAIEPQTQTWPWAAAGAQMSPWPELTVKATHMCMVPAAAKPLDINMVSDNRHLSVKATNINTDPSYSRATDIDTALSCTSTNIAWPQVAVWVTHVTLFLTTISSTVMLLFIVMALTHPGRGIPLGLRNFFKKILLSKTES